MNRDKLIDIFMAIFEVDEKTALSMRYKDGSWDSVGHMMLISEIESTFNIELETEEIVEIDSFYRALEILDKYNGR